VRYDLKQWWENWWEEDYSWEGLAKVNEDGMPNKPWLGWCVLKDGSVVEDPSSWQKGHNNFGPRPEGARLATLQDFWRDQEDELIKCPQSGKKFTILHLPLVWENGDLTPSVDQNPLLKKVLDFSLSRERGFLGESVGPSRCAQLSGAVFRKFDARASSNLITENNELRICADFSNCFFSAGAFFEAIVIERDTIFEKSAFAGDARFSKAKFNDEISFQKAVFGEYARFDGAVFLKACRFDAAKFLLSATYHGATFSGDTHFNGAAFSDDANFDFAAFSQRVEFTRAAFTGYLSVSSAIFSEVTTFSCAAFLVGASFENTTFFADANFFEASFLSDASFGSATFFRDAEFKSAVFFGDADFDSAVFSGPTGFNCVAFSGDACFKNAAFSDDAWFDRAIFAKQADFSGKGVLLEMPEQGQLLSLTTGDGPAIGLDGTLITPKALLPSAQRSFKKIDATGAIFLKDALFDNRDIHEPSSFRDCLFMRRASFHGSKLHQGVTFHGAVFEACLNPARQCVAEAKGDPVYEIPKRALIRLHDVVAKRMELLHESEVNYNKWLHSFEAERKEAAIDFCNLPQKTEDGETGNSKDRYFADLEDAFRTLKRAMEDNRNRPEEGRFFKLELQARRRRRRPAVPWWERGMSDLYLWSSDFGNSVVKPVVWLNVVIVLFAYLYACLATFPQRAPKGVELAEATSFSLGRVLPFGPWVDEPVACSAAGRLLDVAPTATEIATNADCKSDLANQYGPFTALSVRLLASIQSFIALVLVFLAALASRRRFQIN
jgi:hypothetical protein